MGSDTDTADRTILDLTATPCGICGPSTRNEEMVGCDGCDNWFHSRCVGLEGLKPKKWYCQNEACQEKAQEYQKQQKDAKKQSRSRKQTDESDKSSVNSRKGSSSVEARVKALEERQKRQLEELEAEMQLRKKEKEMQRAFERKKLEMEMQMRAEEEEEQRALQEEFLKKKKKQIQRMMANQQSFEKQVEAMDKKLAELAVVKVPKTVPKTADGGMEAEPSAKGNRKKLTKENLSKLSEGNEDTDDDDTEEDDNRSDGSRHSSKLSEPSPKSIPQSAKDVNDRSQNGLGQKQVGPTKAQLAARKGLTFNLPKFSGKPAQWPLFYAAYKTSNETCGYMDHENLMRLQDSLEGDALELVSGQLLLPESIPRVIEKLRRHYGRPEQLLQHLLDKVDQLEPPKPDNLGSFVPFGNTVEQLCGHLEAADLRQHLVNPLLIKSLVAKLPDREKREWVRYKRGKEEPTLRTLTDFLMEIVEDACEANVDVEFKPVYPSKGDPLIRKQKPLEKVALHYHSEASSPGTSSSNQKRLISCKLCDSTEHPLRHCADFKELSYAERLKLITREKLCSVCLNEHGGQCKFKTCCNVGDCKEYHNPLMHPVENAGAIGMSAHIRSNCTVMFRMLPVQLYCGGKSITVLAFLDEGSSVTLLEQNLADRLGIIGVRERLTIKWTADVMREEGESRRMNLWASGVSAGANNKLLLHSVHTVEKLMLPRQTLDCQELAAQYEHMRGLPIESYNGQPGLLIGLNNIHSFAPVDAKVGTPVEPIAVQCKLGWTVYGPKHSTTVSAVNYFGYHQEHANEYSDVQFESNNAPKESMAVVPQKSAEEKRAREVYKRTAELRSKKKYPQFTDSFPMAARKMKGLEKYSELHETVCKQCDSGDTVEDAGKLAQVPRKPGFDIRNSMSNSPEVLRSLGKSKPITRVHFHQDKQTRKERVLGEIWNPDLDESAFLVIHHEELARLYKRKRPTTRPAANGVMRCVELFPLFNIHGQINIQGLKRSNCDWDQDIDVKCGKLWRRWNSLLPEEVIRIPCRYFGDAEHAEIDSLHGQAVCNGNSLLLRRDELTFEKIDDDARCVVLFNGMLEAVKLVAIQISLVQELQQAETFLWRLAKWDTYLDEMRAVIKQGTRTKWCSEQKQLEEDAFARDLVFVVDEKQKQKCQRRSIVEVFIIDSSVQTRQVNVRNADGTVKTHGELCGVRNLVNPELPEVPAVTGWGVATPQKHSWQHCIAVRQIECHL